jgi:hypothetical protein
MFLLCLYLIVLIIVIILFLYSKKEGFETMTTSTQNTTKVLPTTSSSFEDMDVIDFSELEDSEKILRDEQSKELNNCLGKYVNRKVKPLRDASEIMFSRVEDCENIFEATEIDNKKKYFEQMEYW